MCRPRPAPQRPAEGVSPSEQIEQLTPDERDYVVDVICRWIERERAVA